MHSHGTHGHFERSTFHAWRNEADLATAFSARVCCSSVKKMTIPIVVRLRPFLALQGNPTITPPPDQAVFLPTLLQMDAGYALA